MGLRETREIPEQTSEVAFSGLSGFTVVFASLNETTPAIQKNTPINAMAEAAISCDESPAGTVGVEEAIPHIARPTTRATIGGGILFSSMRISVI